MPRTILILGASGRFGRHAALAFQRHGWTVRRFRRGTDTLPDAAIGADIILNAWNPPYPDWSRLVPGLTASVIAAAQATGAAVMVPGNVYVYGASMPPVIGPQTPQAARNPLGRVRVEMETSYRASGVRTVILRAGDFLDTEASGNWFDRVIAAKARDGRLTYPGPPDVPHAWAFLPDLAEAFAALADKVDDLPMFSDLGFEGYTLTGTELANAVADALGRPIRVKPMAWMPLQLARPFWPVARHLIEMHYLWRVPHRVDGTALKALLPEMEATPLTLAMQQALKG
jgi:nucleoside-diphosphate-sugar epimerase